MTTYSNVYNTRKTPQTQPIPGRTDQVVNHNAGYVFTLDVWNRLNQFLILGTSSNTFYVSQQALTKENAKSVHDAIKEDGPRVVARIVEVSEKGLAPSNDPALFALAMCASLGNETTRKAAFLAVTKVCRIGTHLFHFVDYTQQFRGWGNGLRKAVANYYLNKTPIELVRDATKYNSRDGYSVRDILRLTHPLAPNRVYQDIFKYLVSGQIPAFAGEDVDNNAYSYLYAVNIIKENDLLLQDILGFIGRFSLPREVVPTELLNKPEVWASLLPHMGMTAMIRNLATMTRNGTIAFGKPEVQYIAHALTNAEKLQKQRVHPITVLNALFTYKSGHSVRGTSTWTPNAQIVNALDKAFYLAFASVQPTNTRISLNVDRSQSMTQGDVGGVIGLTPRKAALAMALVTLNSEPEGNVKVNAFAESIVELGVTKGQRLDDAIAVLEKVIEPKYTDCAQPILDAIKRKELFDVFVLITDSETFGGNIHVIQALEQYRTQTGIPAKLVVIGMVANGLSVGDPKDPLTLQIVGFDASAPALINNFITGEF